MFKLLIITAFLSYVCAQGVQFQGANLNLNQQAQSHDRQPIVSDKCAEGEYLYPGDNVGDWVCDCKPKYIYYPKDMKCYEAYTQGPCVQGQILIIPKSNLVPKCIVNPCRNNGEIKFRDRCGKLNENGACAPNKNLHLLINATTLEPVCSIKFFTRFGDEETVELPDPIPSGFCYPGSKRAQSGC